MKRHFAGLVTALLCLASSALAGEFSYLAYGELRGHLEPCGCDPLTDLGGYRRLATLIQRERATHPDLVLFDLGNNLPPPSRAVEDSKIPYLLEASAALQPDAVLLNVLELPHLAQIKDTPLPFVLSNTSENAPAIAPNVTPTRLARDKATIVLGYVSPQKPSTVKLEKFSAKLRQQWKSLVAHHEHAVLLFSGSLADLKAIAAAKIFSEIISASRAPVDEEPTDAEQKDETKLFQADTGVFSVPMGGQGILRGGGMKKIASKSLLADIQPSCLAAGVPSLPWVQCHSPNDGFPARASNVTWLDRSLDGLLPADAPMEKVFTRYAQVAADAMKAQVEARRKDLGNTPFASANVCQSCHPKAVATWRNSGHAHALKALKDKHKDQDPECVSCHVLGMHTQGGFVSEADSPQFANVQCENCHGPMLGHTANPKLIKSKVTDPKAACVECHKPPHTAHFDFKTYWQKIEHGRG